jgi:hypothetical protein
MNLKFTNNQIEIDPKCKKLINDLERVVWKNNKPDQTGANKMLTHSSDNLGYGVWHLSPLTPKVPKIKTQTRM